MYVQGKNLQITIISQLFQITSYRYHTYFQTSYGYLSFGATEKLWMLHPCKCSVSGLMGPRATWSSERGPCPWQGAGLDDRWKFFLA